MKNIYHHANSIFSSIGNDGIIEFIFRQFSFSYSRCFIEFGAHNGIHGSNTRHLLQTRNWEGLYIESSLRRFLPLLFNTFKYPQVKCVKALVSSRSDSLFSLDNIWSSSKLADPSLVCIDVDGIDFEILSSIERIKPLVYCIEGGQMLPPFHEPIASQLAANNIQQSLASIKNIAESKGYKVLCSSQDTFLIRDDVSHLFDDYLSHDLCAIYEAGLIYQKRRIPWISEVLKKNSLQNPIIESVLKNSNYCQYGFKNRFQWSSQDPTIIPAIKEAILAYKNSNL